MGLLHAPSWLLFECQMEIGPVAFAAPVLAAPPPLHAVVTPTATATEAATSARELDRVRDLISSPCVGVRGSQRSKRTAKPCVDAGGKGSTSCYYAVDLQ